MFEVGDYIVKWPGTKIYIVTDVFEGFVQAKLFLFSVEESRFRKILNEKKIFEEHPVDLHKITFKANKFRIGDKIFFTDERDPNRGTVPGEISGYTVETLQFPGHGDTEVEVKYYYFIKVNDDANSYYSKSTLIPEKQIFKIINTNNLWNDVCSSTE